MAMDDSSHLDELFRSALPPDAAVRGEALQAFAADGLAPQLLLLPGSLDELSRCVAVANEAGLAALPAGNGTHLSMGRVPERYDVAISTRRLNRIVAHEAADMTVTVQAGVTLAAADRTLGAAAQRLPLDPPLAEEATVGAVIATDAAGPLRLAHGKVRDLLIGVTVVLADGRIVHGGGRVVKNVAGYDLMKLFAGSHGTLGIIAEATFKVRPRAENSRLCLVAARDRNEAVGLGLDVCASLQPAFAEILDPLAASRLGVGAGDTCVFGFEGVEAELAAQTQRLRDRALGGDVVICEAGETERIVGVVRDFPARAADAATEVGCKISVLPTKLGEVLSGVHEQAQRCGVDAATVARVGSGVAVLRAGGADCEDKVLVDFLGAVRAVAAESGGGAVLDRLPTRLKGAIDPWGPEPPGMRLMRGVKTTLDARRLFSPGTFVGGI
jgi:glycolate oxidase FAD binding subunit